MNSKCGYQAQYHSDNLCKVYDVRMLRQGMPLQFTYNSAPAYSTFLPTEETNSATPGKELKKLKKILKSEGAVREWSTLVIVIVIFMT